MNDQTIVLDNGSSHIKGGFAGIDDPKVIMANCVGTPRRETFRRLVGQDCENIDLVGDFSQLLYSRPFEKGYLTNWQLQTEVWDRMFSKDYLDIDPKTSTLLVTEPPCNLPRFKAEMDQVVFEYYGFDSYARTTAAWLAAQHYVDEHPNSSFSKAPCRLIVDSGFSFTNVVPVFDQFCMQAATKRVGVGGKAVTNFLKEIVSYRHRPMMEEWHVINELKEIGCRVSLDYCSESKKIAAYPPSTYLLPDFRTVHSGKMLSTSSVAAETGSSNSSSSSSSNSSSSSSTSGDVEMRESSWDEEQLLHLTTELIRAPELLFNPMDVGIQQGGVSHAIMQSLQACHSDLVGPLLSNILLVGGNVNLPGFKERVERELRMAAPDHFPINISVPDDPINAAWRGGSSVASNSKFVEQLVTKEEYEEHGHSVCQRRFLR
jgi:actin-related protein 6